MKRLTSLGVVALAAAAVALGGVASPVAAKKVCSDSSGGYHIKHRKNVSCKDARTVLDKYLTDPNAGSTGKVGGGWRCPHPYNEEQGKCTNKKKKSASFKYKNGYAGT